MAGVASKVRIVYAQFGETVLTKDILEPHGDTIEIKLTQAETLLFHPKRKVEIQLRVLTDDGDALTSDISVIEPYRCLEMRVFE
jgi:hypothetical protein